MEHVENENGTKLDYSCVLFLQENLSRQLLHLSFHVTSKQFVVLGFDVADLSGNTTAEGRLHFKIAFDMKGNYDHAEVGKF